MSERTGRILEAVFAVVGFIFYIAWGDVGPYILAALIIPPVLWYRSSRGKRK